MDRMACLDLPALPLQLLLKHHPEWRARPAAVVDVDKPQGLVLWVNERARARRVLPGMRYAAALAFASDLRAAPVSRGAIEQAVRDVAQLLERFTPRIEPAADEPGLFWLDASGLERLHASLAHWGEAIRTALAGVGLEAGLAVGFGRFATYAAARTRRGLVVFRDRDEENAAARAVPLERLGLAAPTREALHRLGVDTVGQLVGLPADGLRRRFGPALERLHREASGALRLPLQPRRVEPPATERILLDHAEVDVLRLLFVIERLLGPLCATVKGRRQAVATLEVGFRFERLGDHVERVRPAAPTRDAAELLGLVRLRLEALRRLPDGVEEIVLLAEAVEVIEEQQRWDVERPRRDLEAANRALARVRAELGEDRVQHARLCEGHLPEGSFAWEALAGLVRARPHEIEPGRLVRRLYAEPIPLPSRPRQEPDGWMPHGLEQGPVVRTHGPYVVDGGWWNRHPIRREYHFAETQKGELLWVYYDRPRRRWFLQGRVE